MSIFSSWTGTVRNPQGTAVPGVCTVYDDDGPAIIYDASAGSAVELPNPYTTDRTGVFTFCAPPGTYYVWMRGEGVVSSKTTVVLQSSSSSVTNIGNTQAFMNKVKRGLEDLVILVLGDSTGNDQTEWPYLLCQQFSSIFPTHTIKHSLWDGSAWPAPSTISSGTGARTITMYNGSVAGSRFSYSQGGRWATMVQALSPDLIFTNYGHNQGSSAVSYTWASEYLCLCESLAEQHPQAAIVHMIQNPGTANNDSGLRATVYEQMARMRGHGLVNIHQVFMDYGASWSTDLMADAIHPNSAGQALWVGEVVKIFNYDRKPYNNTQSPSLFTQKGGMQLLKNGDFSGFSAALPDNWVQLSGSATASKDNTNYESANGYSVIMQAAGGVGCALGQTLPLNLCLGKWITALVRIRVEIGATDNTGVVALYNNVDGSFKENDIGRGYAYGAFRWVVVRMYVPTNATTVRLYIWPDTSTTNAACRVDYASVVAGPVPMR